jgi:predicted RNA-binding Zn-ribbon protein involved in translation (DUF1610 family)
LGEKKVMFASVHDSSPKRMLRKIHMLLDEADAVITYYGDNFDLPTLSKEFVTHGFMPPSPVKKIDLCKIVQTTFRFPSNKLDFVAQALGLGHKERHEGFEMWVKCMAGDAKAWRAMEKYNRRDVTLLEELYDKLRPWIKSHPNHRLYDESALCPNCGSTRHQRRGYAMTRAFKYSRYQCLDCGAWFRGVHAQRGPRERYVPVA